MGKISSYAAMVSTDVAGGDDLPIVDVSATATKRIIAGNLLQALLLVAGTGGGASDLTYDGTTLTLASGKALVSPTVSAGSAANVGSSGVAGTVSVFPTTASKGKTTFTASDNSGNTTTNVNTAAQAGARTYTVPDAGVSASFVMTAGNQTVAGNKTLTGTTEADTLNVGASGTAGALSVFPATAAKGSTLFTASNNSGNTVTTINTAAQATTRAYTVPDAGADASFVMTQGNQTLAGNKTLTGTTEADTLNVGASGTAGVLNVFPASGTAAKGKLLVSVGDQAANSTVTLAIAALAAARTVNIQDALANGDLLIGQQAAVARTATSDGLTTGTIADGGCRQFVVVTSASANNIITLPTPTPGVEIKCYVGANGFKFQSSAPSTVAINGGTGAAAKSAIPVNSTAIMVCESATSWKGFYMSADGTPTKVPAAA